MNDYGKDEFRAFILSCYANRIDGLSDDFSRTKEYLDFVNRTQPITDKLQAALPGDLYKLILEYKEACADLLLEKEEFFYKHGFMDCRMLAKWLI